MVVCGVSGANIDSVRDWPIHFLQRAGILGHSGRPLVCGSGVMAEYCPKRLVWWEDVGTGKPMTNQ